ncbi:MAG: ribose-phosphate diphosphokinase [Holosporaceae bacterium]
MSFLSTPLAPIASDKTTPSFAFFANPKQTPLAEGVARLLNTKLNPVAHKRFADGELKVTLPPKKDAATAIIVQQVTTHTQLMTLLLTLQALKHQGYQNRIACVPYLFYTRQDQASDLSGHPLSLVLQLLQQAGATHLVLLDAHNEALPVPHGLQAHYATTTDLFAKSIQKRFAHLADLCVVSPDAGSATRAEHLAAALKVPFVVCTKKRTACKKGPHLTLQASIPAKRVLLVDDIIDSGHTLQAAAQLLKARGVQEVHAYVTHGVLSNKTFCTEASRKALALDTLTLTNTLAPNLPSFALSASTFLRPFLDATVPLAAAIKKSATTHNTRATAS